MPTNDLISATASAEEDPDINCEEPTSAEVAIAITWLKNGKAPGVCGITADMLKAGGTCSVEWLTKVCQNAWRSDTVPPDWKEGVIIPIYKGKGSRKECQNYRGITLLSVPGKVLAAVLLNRVKTKLLQARRREQSGFTPGRSTTERIFTLNTLIHTSKEFNQPLWIAYVDLKSTFDSVDRESLWLLFRDKVYLCR